MNPIGVSTEIAIPAVADYERAKTVNEIAREEDSIGKQKIAVEYILEGTTALREAGLLPDHNSLTALIESYAKQGGDTVGACLGIIWAFGLAPDAPQDVIDSLRQLGEIEHDAIVGQLVFEKEHHLIEWIDFENEEMLNINWKDYMENNPILLGKVGDVLIPIGTNLEKGQSRNINMSFHMVIENGEGFTGYEFLPGTNLAAGGFQIDGTVKKSYNGSVTYDLTYTWNDIIDPALIYPSDRDKSETAYANLNPKDYVIRIKWSDKSVFLLKLKINIRIKPVRMLSSNERSPVGGLFSDQNDESKIKSSSFFHIKNYSTHEQIVTFVVYQYNVLEDENCFFNIDYIYINRDSETEEVIEDGIVKVPAGETLRISVDATAKDSSKALKTRGGSSVKIVVLDN